MTQPSRTSFKTVSSFKLLKALNRRGASAFENALRDTEATQRKKLASLLKLAEKTESGRKYELSEKMGYAQFSNTFPVTEYTDWEHDVLLQKKTSLPRLTREVCERYQPTSGSSSKMKWIPYTPTFLKELDAAVSPMLVDAITNHPGICKGKHYWSLSWVPTHLRQTISQASNDDTRLLPWWKRIFLQETMAVPNGVASTATSQGSMLASLAYLVATRDLALLSVWSPTFALNLFEQMANSRQELAHILRHGDWGERGQELSHIPCPSAPGTAEILTHWDGEVTPEILHTLWPKMALLSAWDTSSSQLWAEQLKKLFPHAGFLSKGLWSTEGVVTLPYKGRHPLAITSHFYEFLDQETGRIHPPWDLEEGQIVRPLLSTGSGFFRYDLKDQVRVSGFMGTCPCFDFLGRTEGIDMVGEKLTPAIAIEVIQKTGKQFEAQTLTLLARPGHQKNREKPYYILLCEAPANPSIEKAIALFATRLLDASFHYKLATEIGQLGPLKVILHPEARHIYQNRNERKGMILGDMKIEPLALWDENDADFWRALMPAFAQEQKRA